MTEWETIVALGFILWAVVWLTYESYRFCRAICRMVGRLIHRIKARKLAHLVEVGQWKCDGCGAHWHDPGCPICD